MLCSDTWDPMAKRLFSCFSMREIISWSSWVVKPSTPKKADTTMHNATDNIMHTWNTQTRLNRTLTLRWLCSPMFYYLDMYSVQLHIKTHQRHITKTYLISFQTAQHPGWTPGKVEEPHPPPLHQLSLAASSLPGTQQCVQLLPTACMHRQKTYWLIRTVIGSTLMLKNASKSIGRQTLLPKFNNSLSKSTNLSRHLTVMGMVALRSLSRSCSLAPLRITT